MITGAKVEDPLNKIWLLSVSAEASVFAPSSFCCQQNLTSLLPHPTAIDDTIASVRAIDKTLFFIVCIPPE